MVEDFLNDNVLFVGVIGKNCEKVEEIIDELVVGDASKSGRFILTSSHPDESLADVVKFVESLSDSYQGMVQVVEL